jgi:hypothetical protein
LILNLPKLSENLIQNDNDNDKLLTELENEINTSIKDFNFEELSIFIGHDNYIQKELMEYENIKNIIIDIDLNSSAINIIQKKIIEFNFQSDNKYIIFFKNLMEKNANFSNLFKKDKNNKNLLYNNLIIL